MLLAYLKVDKLFCAVKLLGSGTRLADSALNSTLYALLYAMAATFLMQVGTPYYIKENYSYYAWFKEDTMNHGHNTYTVMLALCLCLHADPCTCTYMYKLKVS